MLRITLTIRVSLVMKKVRSRLASFLRTLLI
jgi:hypothetical protein